MSDRRIALGELLSPVARPESVNPEAKYRLLGARWYAKGLFVKEVASGAEIRASKLYRVERGDFVYNRLFAWKGSFAVASEDVDGCFVSNEFPCFQIDDGRLDSRFLAYYFSLESVWIEALGLSTGGTPTSRNRLNERKLQQMTIPLPPLEEQRRIVARLDAVLGKLEEARRLAGLIDECSLKLLSSAFSRATGGSPGKRMSEIAPLVRRPVAVDPFGTYHELGIRSFGRGVFHKPPVPGSDLGSKRVYSIKPGDLLFSNVFAWEGAVAVAGTEDEGRIGSHRFITCVPKSGEVLAEFLAFYFSTREGLDQLGKASPGGAGRNRTLGLSTLAALLVPTPPVDLQQGFVRLLHRMRDADRIRSDQGLRISRLQALFIRSVFDSSND